SLLPLFVFFTHPPATEISTLSLHDALPISAISRVLIPTGGGGAYGEGLRSSMRQAGYAVIETGKGVKPDPAATPLRYYVDQPIADSYRVTLRVGAQTFSRIYGVDEKGIYPSAGWALDLTGATPELIERANRPVAPAAPPPDP